MATSRDVLQTLEITDFTPGIYSAGGKPTRLIPAPLGAAQLTNTYRCVGLKNGGLGPLPKVIPTFDAPSNLDSGTAPVNKYVAVGFFAMGEVQTLTNLPTFAPDELHLDIQYTFPGSPNITKFRWFRLRTFEFPVTADLLRTETAAVYPMVGASLVGTRMIVPGSTVPQNNQMLLAHSWRDASLAVFRFYVFPDPSTPALNNIVINSGAEASGMLIAHQSRILILQATIEDHGVNAITFTNELINYTDPPLTSNIPAQMVQLGTEFPYGYGSFGSISAGELLLIKKFGGALLVSGDIFAPSVTSLPGVASTGNATNEGTFSPIGLIYVGNNGTAVYAWNGSSASEVLSENIDMNTAPLLRTDFPETWSSLGLQYWHELWGNFVVFSNNYLLDTATRSWWILEDPTVYNVGMMTKSKVRTAMYFIKSTWSMGDTQQIAVGALSQLAESYSWNSQPIPVSIRKVIEVRRIDVLASAESGTTSTVTLTLTAMDGSTQTKTVAITPSGQPVRVTTPFSIKGTNLVLRIQADSGNASIDAPIVYGVTAYYYEDTSLADA